MEIYHVGSTVRIPLLFHSCCSQGRTYQTTEGWDPVAPVR